MKINDELCNGCQNCFARCPSYAISMIKRSQPIKLYVDPKQVDESKIREICLRAHMHPKQIACDCTGTFVEEIVASILKGAKNPTDITRLTGARSGCKQFCIQPMLRLLEAAGIHVSPANGWQWYGRTPTVWEVPNEIKQKHHAHRFDDDARFIEKLIGESES